MVKYVFCNDMFHNFTTDTSERDWSVICCVVFFTFFVCWCNICMFQSVGMQPVWSDFWKIMFIFSILPLMLSGPLALCGLMLLSSFWMPCVVMVSDGITGCGLTPLLGMLSIDSVVNTDLNCSFKMFAFCLVSATSCPSFFQGSNSTVVSSEWLYEGEEFFWFRLIIKTLIWIICWKV